MKNVLLLVHEDPGQEARFQAALDLTRALRGHLTCLSVSEIPVIVGDVYAFSVGEILLVEEQVRAAEARNRERLEARLAREDVPWTWIGATGSLAGALKDAAGMADLIVVSRRLDSDSLPDMRAIASEVAIGSGRAVVAVPESPVGFQAAGHAMVAWNGSDESVTALQSAVPLLKLAGTVTLVEIDDGSAKTPVEEAASYLSRHDISAVVIRRRGKPLPTGDALLAEAKAEGADYIVLGAFGRGRIVEAVFGGVSREMLSESPIPVLMRH